MNWLMLIVFLFHSGLILSSYAQNSADKILELINIINFSYVDSVDGNKLSEAAITAMLAELDPHSMYIPKEEVNEMNELLNGNYEGIGIQFNLIGDSVVVVSTISGGPSEKLGIRSGDRLIEADDMGLSGVGIKEDEVVRILRGKKGTEIRVKVLKTGSGQLVEYKITRDKIPIYSVDASYMLDDKIGYIKINRFSQTTHDEFLSAIDELEKEGMESLILDLRGNGGGYLYSAVRIADELLENNKTIVKTSGLRQPEQVYSSSDKGKFQKGKLVLLINEGSASASEIVAGAVQDWDRGIILGRRSFGKGLVLKPYTLSDGSMIRLTTAHYYTPSGRSIQKDYHKSKQEYEEEINRRYKHGELYHVDSIPIPEDLKFKTSRGRTVFGGGGIYPDVFVPADSLIDHKIFQKLLQHGAFSKFSIHYSDENNRQGLLDTYDDPLKFALDTNRNEELISEFERFITENNILNNEIPPEIEVKVINYVKAYLVRHLYDTENYYKVINLGIKEIEVAMDILNNKETNWENLTYKSE